MQAAHTHKSDKIALLLPPEQADLLPAHYRGYFACFDAQLYYEAHDVLEELWLGNRGHETYHYFKGLIQLAGCFVHIQKNRLVPATRLHDLAWSNLEKFLPHYWGLDLESLKRTTQPYCDHLKNEQPGDVLEVLGPPKITPLLDPRRPE